MIIEQIYTGCLAEAAYYITSLNEAVIIDPLRDIDPYLDRLEKDGVCLKYIFETHFHADFVSGHVDLAKKTGAKIIYGPTNLKTGFDSYIGTDGEVFLFGESKIKLIHTPGHTLESSCFLLIDENNVEKGLVTGDTLFIGDVGRPDLAQHVIADLTQDKLARLLYHSLHNKILPLSDELIIYPNHGAGSACGKNMSKETTDTLGNQKRTNYALNKSLTEDDFVVAVLDGLTNPPNYFPKNVLLNIQGAENLDSVIERENNPISLNEFEKLLEKNDIVVLDTRSPEEFANGFIPKSLNIGINGNFAQWVGELLPIEQKLIVITDTDKLKETLTRLSRIGFDNVIGYLNGGFETWKNNNKPIDTIQRIDARELEEMLLKKDVPVFDVRKESEYNSEHLREAKNIPLNVLVYNLEKFPKDKNFIIHCAGGYRSIMAASLLKQNGIDNFIEVKDGFSGIKKTILSLTDYVCPKSML